RHTRSTRDWSSDVCSSDLPVIQIKGDKVLIENACLQIPGETGFQAFAEEVTKLVSQCDHKYSDTKYGPEVTDWLMTLCQQLERMVEPKLDEEERRKQPSHGQRGRR